LPAENKFLKYILTYSEKSVNEIIFQALHQGIIFEFFSHLRVMRSDERICFARENFVQKITRSTQSK
jgi:hypothetical protein